MDSFKKRLLVSFGIIIVSVAAAVAGLSVLSGNIAAQVVKIQSDRAVIQQNINSLDIAAGLEKQAPIAAAYEAAIDQIMPTQNGLIGFSQWIGSIASANQVTATVSFTGDSTPSSKTLPGSSGFSLEVDGSLPNIISFLDDVEAQSPGFLVQLSSFDLTAPDSGSRLTAQGVVFFQSSP